MTGGRSIRRCRMNGRVIWMFQCLLDRCRF
ncbi:unnamed protein product [Spirodela intermedia]|uniref:Uncharacterized protein n=2 Tax=Spirodela intermedia TaxID=51605 RepID=A0A7I8KDZ4_SPIIN|nr:unnamed protein product [Spirodela intermedia]CAA6659407.1 unnamed protein product [Spirodela intermedia]CAA7395722.1 unnamed protein product [Spirodela intermedia]